MRVLKMMVRLRMPALVVLYASLVGCDGHDSEYYPYTMKGLNALVYDNASGKEYFAGFIEASYFSRSEAASKCAALAARAAAANHLREWSYVCCTVTSSSDCVTKVR